MERRRIITLFVIFLIPLMVIEAKLFTLQCLESERYAQEFESYIYDVEVTPAGRGRILARDGTLMAAETRAFNLYVILSEFEKEPKHLAALAAMLARPDGTVGVAETVIRLEEQIDRINAAIERMTTFQPASDYAKVVRQERRTPYLLWEDIDFRVAMKIETHPELVPGAVVRETFRRVYPLGTTAAHIVGYLGKRNKQEYREFLESGALEEYEEIVGEYGTRLIEKRGYFMDDLIGRAGVEKAMDMRLRGKAGIALNERNTFRKTRETIGAMHPEMGEDVLLTIDLPLQKILENALAGRRGAAIVLDVRNGEVLAMASAPSYDPGDLIPPVSRKDYEKYMNDRATPMVDRAISGVYQLGSIFKVVTAVAALEGGKVTPATEFDCQGRYSPKMEKFACWIDQHQSVHGKLTLPEAIARSCNVYFYNSGRIAGIESLSSWAAKFGFGAPTGIDLPEEKGGLLPREPWDKWVFQDAMNMGIGQGYLSVTPMQAVVTMAAIANGGSRVTPHVVKGMEKEPVALGISPSTLEEIRKGLKAVVHESYGTAHRSDLKLYDAAGKTSSAQTGPGSVSHAWFAGYFPTEAPRYAFVAMVEHGGSGGEVAAPIAVKIVERLTKIGADE